MRTRKVTTAAAGIEGDHVSLVFVTEDREPCVYRMTWKDALRLVTQIEKAADRKAGKHRRRANTQ